MTRTHLLVTNDFPPKVGGIQSYLWELWRRLDPASFTVLTSPYAGAAAWDAEQPFRVVRTREPVLLPHPWMVRRVNSLAAEIDAAFVVIDPAVPLGIIGPRLDRPYGVVLHGAEVAIPGRLPLARSSLAHVLRREMRVVGRGHEKQAAPVAGHAVPDGALPIGVAVVRRQSAASAGEVAAINPSPGGIISHSGAAIVGTVAVTAAPGFGDMAPALQGRGADRPGGRRPGRDRVGAAQPPA